ncbi:MULTISPECIES: hypothetical protein [unclassified Paenibacillus]|uniref:hypothetical protein n=1 Tax=unclassified Paenibacillus TaxID=185978 RepID=UPI001F3A9A62|nr:hypothetical protein [Paenibacillus sp. JJ-223]CAH1224673.1 hypothetical protein PAECIP111890_05711 [Paenibacillus sp. JJ-223]
MKLSDFKNLPDVMSKEDLNKHFEAYLDLVENVEKLDSIDVLETLSELADRKVYTHELLEFNLRSRVDHIVQKLWDVSSAELVDYYTYVVVNLNLAKSYELMKSALNMDLDKQVREIIEETIDEVGADIDIPYKSN